MSCCGEIRQIMPELYQILLHNNSEMMKEFLQIQSTLVISTSLISNNCLSRSENLVPVLTQRSTNRYKILWKREEIAPGAISLFHFIFNISNSGVKLHIHYVKVGCSINCLPQFRRSDKYGYLEVFHRIPWISR